MNDSILLRALKARGRPVSLERYVAFDLLISEAEARQRLQNGTLPTEYLGSLPCLLSEYNASFLGDCRIEKNLSDEEE